MKNARQADQGFTIVELLIVIVVIAILAAITIVAYSGVTSRAKASTAVAQAQNVDQTAEAYNAAVGNYPAISDFASAPSGVTLPSGISLVSFTAASGGALSDSNGQTTIAYEVCSNGTTNVGAQIIWWDYTSGALSNTNSSLSPNTYLLGTSSGSGITCS